MYSGHLHAHTHIFTHTGGQRSCDFPGVWRAPPGEVHEVKGEVVGLCEWVEVDVVVAKQVVAAERTKGSHLLFSSFRQCRNFEVPFRINRK